jgi:hypothetical protein
MNQLAGSLTREERMQVARDVLARLAVADGSIQIQRGIYFGWANSSDDDGELEDAALVEGEQHPREFAPCVVCARGAFFLASVDRFDRCSLPRGASLSDAVLNRTHSDWGQQAVKEIEAAFEIYPGWSEAAAGFGRRYRLSIDRLRAICENIVMNNGEFCPLAQETANE